MSTQFWSMGGYATYVWSAYAVALGVLAWNILSPWRRHRALRRELERSLEASS